MSPRRWNQRSGRAIIIGVIITAAITMAGAIIAGIGDGVTTAVIIMDGTSIIAAMADGAITDAADLALSAMN
ncbi:hypothetical protein [Terrarubrum flagellatum]|uniref:hypothetical protein n=1 Tax=Terrirubrum flagellatum TaxID=2895980 RepID=UPI0031456834